MSVKRFNKVKQLYENIIINDLYKKSDLMDELLGKEPTENKQEEEDYEDVDVDELTKELLGGAPEETGEKKPPKEKLGPQIPHRLPPKQLKMFPEEKGTIQEPSQFTSGEIMGKVCPVCAHKNFPGSKTQCERCSRLYKKVDDLVELQGFSPEEAIDYVAKQNKSFIGPTALKEIYDRKGEIDLPEKLEELTFTDRRGLSGTPNMLKMKNLLENRFNIVKDKNGEPQFDEQGLSIPLPRKERTHFDMKEVAKKLLLSEKAFLDQINEYNMKNFGAEKIKPATKINENLQIFRWKDVYPVFKERVKDLVENVLPQRHIERLQKMLERNIANTRKVQDLKKYWEDADAELDAKIKEEKRQHYDKIPDYLANRFKELRKLRKFRINNKKRQELEKAFGESFDKFLKELKDITDESKDDRERIKSLIDNAGGRINFEKERIANTQNKLIEYRAAMGKPVPDVELETMGLNDLEKAEEGLDFETSELTDELLGKTSRIQQLHKLLKISADQPYFPGFFKEKVRPEKPKEIVDSVEKKIENIMKRRNVSREEAEKILENQKEDIIKDVMRKRQLSREDAIDFLEEQKEIAREEGKIGFKPRPTGFKEPEKKEELKFSEKICPYCGKNEIFEGSEICNFCKANVAENKRNIVIKRTMWIPLKDEEGEPVINEDTGNIKRIPFPIFSLVTLTMENGEPKKAQVKKVTSVSPNVGAKTLQERQELYKRKPKIRLPGATTKNLEDFRETSKGTTEHKQQSPNCPLPWEEVGIKDYEKCKEIGAAVAFINGETLPNGITAWELKDVIDIKEPIRSTQKITEQARIEKED